MKTMISIVAVLVAASAMAAEISDVTVQQMKPWSNKVKVTYTLSDVSAPTDVQVKFFSGDTELAGSLKGRFSGDALYGIAADGTYSFTFDPAAVFATSDVAIGDFKVQLTAVASPDNINEVIYKIFTIGKWESLPCVNVTRADILNGKYGDYETDYAKIGDGFNTAIPADEVLIWTGVTNDIAYKTDKLVLRKIPAAGQSFKMGPNGGSANVSFDDNYWMGVFEVTAYQQRKMIKAWIDSGRNYNPYETNRTQIVSGTITVGDICPADQLWWSGVRSYNSGTETWWPLGGHADVYTWSQLGRLQYHSKFTFGEKLLFDLPTSAEWEYAARAGTTNALPSGKVFSAANYKEIGRGWGYNCVVDTSGDGTFPKRNCSIDRGCGMVGQYRPNAYGLYDVAGNALEFCLDNGNDAYSYDGLTDPKGPTTPAATDDGGRRIIRGGSYRYQFNDVGMTSWARVYYNTADFGYRICLHEKEH